MNLKCLKTFGVEYSTHWGVCGDGCCSGLYSGEEIFTFEADEVYEVEDFSEDEEFVRFTYETDFFDQVYVVFVKSQEKFEDYFERLT